MPTTSASASRMRRRRFGDAELEVGIGVGKLLVELADHLELALGVGALPEKGLGLGLVVPEARSAGLFVQLSEFSFELGDVKDAPLAQLGAS